MNVFRVWLFLGKTIDLCYEHGVLTDQGQAWALTHDRSARFTLAEWWLEKVAQEIADEFSLTFVDTIFSFAAEEEQLEQAVVQCTNALALFYGIAFGALVGCTHEKPLLSENTQK